jgi:hypothetical protein
VDLQIFQPVGELSVFALNLMIASGELNGAWDIADELAININFCAGGFCKFTVPVETAGELAGVELPCDRSAPADISSPRGVGVSLGEVAASG